MRFIHFALAAFLPIATACDAAADLLAPVPTNATVTFVISATCSGRLGGYSVNVWVNDNYIGQAGVGNRVSAEVPVGTNRYLARTDGGLRWGPGELTVGSGGLEYTLNC